MVPLEFASYLRGIARSPAIPVILGIYAKNVVIWVIGEKGIREGGMIRFVKKTIFSGVQRAFFIRKATDSIVKVRTIRFVGLPFMFVGRADRRTGAWRQFPKDSRQQFSDSCGRLRPTGNLQNTILRVIGRLL